MPAEPLTPAEPAPEAIPEPEEPTEVEEPIPSEPLPPEAGSGTGSTPGPTTPEEVEPRPGPTVPPPGPPQFTGCEWETGEMGGIEDDLEVVGDPCGCAERYDPYEVVTMIVLSTWFMRSTRRRAGGLMSIWGEIKHGAEKVGGVVTGTADKAGDKVAEKLEGLSSGAWEKVESTARSVFDKAMAAIVSRGARKALDLLLDEAKHAARGAVARVTLPVVPGFLHVRLKVTLEREAGRKYGFLRDQPYACRAAATGWQWSRSPDRSRHRRRGGTPATDRHRARPGRARESVGVNARAARQASAKAVLIDYRAFISTASRDS